MSRRKKKNVIHAVEPSLPTQLVFRAKLKALKQAMEQAKEAYYEAKADCLHTIEYSYTSEKIGNTTYYDGGTWCADCNTDFGHYCPESPDHACHYFTEDGLHVLLNDGRTVQKPIEPPDPEWDFVTVEQDCRKWETDDVCLFCGHPQERK